MSSVVIKTNNLSKQYRIGIREEVDDSLYNAAASFLSSPLRQFKKLQKLTKFDASSEDNDIFWALKNITFCVNKGDIVGIIGRNGAGKSTLLKILSRITHPSGGSAIIKGRIGSLLEVGTGFHPELTGRENIYLNGAILGMKKNEIDQNFEEIVEFSEVNKFLDTPVKRYSSGMRVRLAFSVAAHLEPEILLIDEVLSVGDISFQKKCIGKMGDVASKGRTILFVSHNMGAINRLCERVILLENGAIKFDGDTIEGVKKYVEGLTPVGSRCVVFQNNFQDPISIEKAHVAACGKGDETALDISDDIYIEIHYQVKQDIRGANISFALKRDGIILFRSWDIDTNKELFEIREKGRYRTRVKLPKRLFAPGRYDVYLAAGRPGVGPIVVHDDCLSFEIDNFHQDISHESFSRGGTLIMPIKWETDRIAKS